MLARYPECGVLMQCMEERNNNGVVKANYMGLHTFGQRCTPEGKNSACTWQKRVAAETWSLNNSTQKLLGERHWQSRATTTAVFSVLAKQNIKLLDYLLCQALGLPPIAAQTSSLDGRKPKPRTAALGDSSLYTIFGTLEKITTKRAQVSKSLCNTMLPGIRDGPHQWRMGTRFIMLAAKQKGVQNCKDYQG
ncbi:hypothetical protein Tco_0591652 [Tanacetum coccineum]